MSPKSDSLQHLALALAIAQAKTFGQTCPSTQGSSATKSSVKIMTAYNMQEAVRTFRLRSFLLILFKVKVRVVGKGRVIVWGVLIEHQMTKAHIQQDS